MSSVATIFVGAEQEAIDAEKVGAAGILGLQVGYPALSLIFCDSAHLVRFQRDTMQHAKRKIFNAECRIDDWDSFHTYIFKARCFQFGFEPDW